MNELIDEYLAGAGRLREALAGFSADELDATPVPGKWSARQVVAHLADCDVVYAERMQRVLAEQEPTIFALDPDEFAAGLAYEQRDVEEELRLIEAVRRHTARILRAAPAGSFARVGRHSADGPLTLETLLRRITGHIPHHVRFLEEKRAALQAARG